MAQTSQIDVLRENIKEAGQHVATECARLTAAAGGPELAGLSAKVRELRMVQRVLELLDGMLGAAADNHALFRPWIEIQCSMWMGITRKWALNERTSTAEVDPAKYDALLRAEAAGLAELEEQTKDWIQYLQRRQNAMVQISPPLAEEFKGLQGSLVLDVEQVIEFICKAFYTNKDAQVSTEVAFVWIKDSLTLALDNARRQAAELEPKLIETEDRVTRQLNKRKYGAM